MKKALLIIITVISSIFSEIVEPTLDEILEVMSAREIEYLHYLMDNDREDDAIIFLQMMVKEHKLVIDVTITD